MIFWTKYCQKTLKPNILIRLRGYSYGIAQTRLSGLAHLGEVSRSLRNSYKNMMCSYEKWARPPRWDLHLI